MSERLIKPFQEEFHNVSGFREQIGIMYPSGIAGDHLKMMRSWIHVCEPGSAGFDPANPGKDDSLEGWKILDDMIENDSVLGICHTHPPGMIEFSDQDHRAQVGLAKANGKKYIWHVVHSVSADIARVLCCHMVNGQVIFYDFGKIECDASDPVVLVPLPPQISQGGLGDVIIKLY